MAQRAIVATAITKVAGLPEYSATAVENLLKLLAIRDPSLALR
ncbi:hypothetical protein SF83666_b62120 (plasmid) [Sinorhizobium fredii CCBAU 83666]|nr:hypothetical protein SF83666_b62120 [Sinorhizobium fredii CCBAU 83666]